MLLTDATYICEQVIDFPIDPGGLTIPSASLSCEADRNTYHDRGFRLLSQEGVEPFVKGKRYRIRIEELP